MEEERDLAAWCRPVKMMMRNFLSISFEREDLEFLANHLPRDLVTLLRSRTSPVPKSPRKVVVELTAAEVDHLAEEVGDILVSQGFDQEWAPTALGLRLEKIIDALTGVLLPKEVPPEF